MIEWAPAPNVACWVILADRVVAILEEPRPCGCGHLAYIAVSRLGKSRCVACDKFPDPL